MNAKEVWDRLKRDAFSSASPSTIDPAAAREVISEALSEALAEKDAEIARRDKVIRLCVSALYEAIEIAPLDRLPRKAGEAIQTAQAEFPALLSLDAPKEVKPCLSGNVLDAGTSLRM